MYEDWDMHILSEVNFRIGRKLVQWCAIRLACTTGIPVFRGGPAPITGPLQFWKGCHFVTTLSLPRKPVQSAPFLGLSHQHSVRQVVSLTYSISNFRRGRNLMQGCHRVFRAGRAMGS